MSIPMFYSFETMSVNEWFNMLANEKPLSEDDESIRDSDDAATYVYQITSTNPFWGNRDVQQPGTYYTRTSAEKAAKLFGCEVHKLSFSELIYLSDIFSSTIAADLISNNDEMKHLVSKGEAAQYFEKEIETIPSKGLEVMREKVWNKYFDKGLMGIVYRFFSALANFFRKYNNHIETSIIWPGNSCAYADQVMNQMNHIKAIFIHHAYEASKEVVSERLGISLDEFNDMGFNAIKKIYHKKAMQIHPDKNSSNPNAVEEFQKVNQVWEDFVALTLLKEKLNDELEIVEDKPYSPILAVHQFKKPLLALTAPIPVN